MWRYFALLLIPLAASSSNVASQASGASAASKESVHAELARLQKQTGLSLVAFLENRLHTVVFEQRSLEVKVFPAKGTAVAGAISPDGNEIAFDLCPEPGFTHPTPYRTECPAGLLYLGISRTDGSALRTYPTLAYPSGICWSPDGSNLLLAGENRKEDKYAAEALQILNLESGSTQEVDGFDMYATDQCWSPDSKKIIYTVNKPQAVQIVRLYDIELNKSLDLANGGNPTWSPDGEWIAFLDCGIELHDCTYYAIRPDGSDRKVLFKTTAATTGLWWSPDSRFVAYVNVGGRAWRLRVRRLDDNSEDWVNLSDADPRWFQWVVTSH
jgi:hypothetical protein